MCRFVRVLSRASQLVGFAIVLGFNGKGWKVRAAHYRFEPAEEAKAFLTAAVSFAQVQEIEPSSQGLERLMNGRLAGRGIFGAKTNGALAS